MKKSLICILSLIVVLLTVLAFAQTPAPFEKAKELALRAKPDSDGDFILEFSCSVNGQDGSFGFAYLLARQIIIVWGSTENGRIYWGYDEEEKIFLYGYRGRIYKVSKKIATEGAFGIFRLLVAKSLI